ncbi:MAG: endonuclease/exonuclease/phosphatase family protein, partial [Oscillospiraceae bacterium]
PDIICLQETRIDGTVSSSELFPRNYIVYRKDRDTNGGGVLVAVSDRLVSCQCFDMDSDTESVWVKISRGKSTPLFVCSFYRPPNSLIVYLNTFRDVLDKLLGRGQVLPHVIITGDFNYPEANWSDSLNAHSENNLACPIFNLVNDFFLAQLVDGPTRFGVNSSNLLDLVLSSYPGLVNNLKVCQLVSDHCYIKFFIKEKVQNILKTPHTVYQYNKANWKAIKKELVEVSELFGRTVGNCSVDENWSCFLTSVNKIIQKHVPTKTLKTFNNCPPWITRQVKRLIRIHDAL